MVCSSTQRIPRAFTSLNVVRLAVSKPQTQSTPSRRAQRATCLAKLAFPHSLA